ncbi:echinoderm microtubule-associated protein-like CG42247 [Oppia nitens]|uniref:echinoderm microtubule-associated protein-like CG42247 n=1 Tax=Oppia nitens TaxID=1686743 RepID=UPI0023DC7BCC|nr:echinoderm microtubule-associated protein-like CG42247 [Oppia nitens]
MSVNFGINNNNNNTNNNSHSNPNPTINATTNGSGAGNNNNNGVSKAIQEASDRKARKLTFYKNGEPFSAATTVSILPGRDFRTMDQLCQYLTERVKIANGVQFIFTCNGHRVLTLNELEHGQSYVVSGSKTFQSFNKIGYGQIGGRPPKVLNGNQAMSEKARAFREDDLKLLRPLSSKFNTIYHNITEPINTSYREGRIITIVNNKDHKLRSRVLLNLKSPKSFDIILKDLGQAVRIKNAKRMFTASGHEVRSVSQLKRDMVGIDLFYLDSNPTDNNNNNNNNNNTSKLSQNQLKSHSLDALNSISASNHYYNTNTNNTNGLHRNVIINGISRNGSTSDVNSSNKRSDSSILSDINPSRRGESSLSERFSLNMEPMNGIGGGDHNFSGLNGDSKSSETQTSPEFVRFSRLNTYEDSVKQSHLMNYLTNRSSQSPPLTSPTHIHIHHNNDHHQHRHHHHHHRNSHTLIEGQLVVDNFDTQKNVIQFIDNSKSNPEFINNKDDDKIIIKTKLKKTKKKTPEDGSNGLPKVKSFVGGNKQFVNDINNNTKNNNEMIDSRRDVLQEYAETLLRETAFLVQSESMREDATVDEKINHMTDMTAEVIKSPHKSPLKTWQSSASKQLSPQLSPQHQHQRQQQPSSPSKSSALLTPMASVSRAQSKNEIYENEMKGKLKKKSAEEEEDDDELDDKEVPKTSERKSVFSSTPSPFRKVQIQTPPPSSQSLMPVMSMPTADTYHNKRLQHQNTLKNPLEYLKTGVNVPDRCLELQKIHGFCGNNGFHNLFILANGELAFYVGTVAVLWNPEDNVQRLYTLHTYDINRMAVRKARSIVATSQEAGKGEPFAMVRIWSAKDLRTIAVLKQNIFGTVISAMDISIEGSLLIINSEKQLNITIWDSKGTEILNSSKKDLKGGETLLGAAFHQSEDDILVTYGNKHLAIWQRKRDGTIDSRNAIKPDSKINKTINCVDFLPDHSLLSGDTTGTLTIWAPVEDDNGLLEFVVKEVKGHEASITCLQLIQNNILITGDMDGTVKTWDANDEQFRLLNAIKLPPTSGAISSITRVHYPNAESDAIEIYIGTSMNMILRGSALQATNYTVIFEGHSLAVRGLAVDPRDACFYSSALDQKVCKWNEMHLIWRTTTESQCVSAAVHPSGEVLAIGSVSGVIYVMSAADGTIISQLPVSKVCIGCLAYSADGDLMAAGCQDGILYILPVLDNGLSYEKVSVLKGPFPILSLQWSTDNQFILTSVNENNYQELLLWDLPNCRYMKGLSNFAESNINWFDPTCSGSEDVRGIWDNHYLQDVVNLSCHCSPTTRYLVSGDEDGVLRLFGYPCTDSKAAFFEYKQGGGSITEARFTPKEDMVVSGNYSGALFVYKCLQLELTTTME